jgi:tetratricopeptide (TPR) repeat protein
LGIKTVSRNTVWKDNYTLFTTDVKTSKNSAKLRNAAGGELVFQSTKTQDEVQKQQMLLEAEGHLKEAVRIHPFYKEAYLILGNCYNYLKRYDESVQAYTKALQIDPSYEEANNNLAITYQQGGRFYGEQQGNLQKAIQYLEQAGRMRPKDFETNRLLGVAYGLLGNPSKAIEFFTKATEIEPNNADAWFMLGTAYYNAGQADVGQQYHEKAISIDPEVTTRMGGGNN